MITDTRRLKQICYLLPLFFYVSFIANAQFAHAEPHADLTVRNAGENTDTGSGVFSSDSFVTAPSGWLSDTQSNPQFKSQSVLQGNSATFIVTVRNVGDTVGRFFLRYHAQSVAGFGVQAQRGEENVTDDLIQNHYFTEVLYPGDSEILTLKVTAASNVPISYSYGLALFASPDIADASEEDAVILQTKILLLRGVDLTIASENETGIAGQGIVNADGEGQQRSQSVAYYNWVRYRVVLTNTGNCEARYRLTGIENGKAQTSTNSQWWNVTYRDQSGRQDVYIRYYSDEFGYSDRTLVPGESYVIWIEISPALNLAIGDSLETLLTATCLDDLSVQDAVVARTVLISGPDLQVKSALDSDSAFVGNDHYHPHIQDVAMQVAARVVPAGMASTFTVRIQNDSSVASAYTLKAYEDEFLDNVQPNWTVEYFVDSTNITQQMTAIAGYRTRILQSGECEPIVVRVNPGTAVLVGSNKTINIKAFNQWPDVVVRDAVQVKAAVTAAPAADAAIKILGETEAQLIGLGWREDLPILQTQRALVSAGATANYESRIENTSSVVSSFVLHAQEDGDNDWATQYFDGEIDITSQIRSSAGYPLGNLNPGQSRTIHTLVDSPTGALSGTWRSVSLLVKTSGTTPLVVDAVRALTIIGEPQPDLMLGVDGEDETGEGVYDSSGTLQVKTQWTTNNRIATYFVTVQNDGVSDDTLNVSASAPIGVASVASGVWTEQYFDEQTNTNITSAVKSDGWPITLKIGQTRRIRIEVTPDSTIAQGSSKSLVLSSVSTIDTNKIDSVKATTVVIAPPDLMAKSSTETDTAYALDNIYQSTPTGAQIKTRAVTTGAKTSYAVRLQNDGSTSRTFILKAFESTSRPAAWGVVYKVGSNAVTSQVKSAAGRISKTLSPGASEVVTVEVTPLSGKGLQAGESINVELRAYSDASGVTSNQVRDSVRLTTAVAPPLVVGVDAAVGTRNSSTFNGTNVINADGTNQSVAQSTPRTVASVFIIRLKNSGNADDKIKLKGGGSGNGWTVKYFDATTNADITSAVVGGKWSTPTLGGGAAYDVRCEVVPLTSVSIGSSRTTLVTATSSKDSKKKDVVKAVVTAAAS